MPSSSPRGSLPFEPRSKKAKKTKKAENQPIKSSPEIDQSVTPSATPSLQTIPDSVSKRMIWRMALFCGIPSALGMASFIVAYFVVSNEWFALPSYAVLLVSLGFFGLGILGLSYGIFSASWDEDRGGTLLGWQEFKLNLGRTIEAWRKERRNMKEN